MNLKLVRRIFNNDGIFGGLFNEQGMLVAHTLEHPYRVGSGWYPKLDAGVYVCKRGSHRLPSMTKDFETFEVMNVPGHTGILFHSGNYARDSNGCILVGLNVLGIMITRSRLALETLMDIQKDVDEFSLTVADE